METLLIKIAEYTIGSLIHNWIPLSLAILTAAIMVAYVDPEKLKESLLGKSKISIPVSVAVGAFTPLCACGTMALVLGMLTAALPWGPIMAFLTSSPLMSPDGFILTAGIIGIEFAAALTIASIIMGLGSGYLTFIIEKRTNFLKNQVRFLQNEKPSGISENRTGGCTGSVPIPVQTKSCNCTADFLSGSKTKNLTEVKNGFSGIQLCCIYPEDKFNERSFYFDYMMLSIAENLGVKIKNFLRNIKWQKIGKAILDTGLKQILLYYILFTSAGFLINYFIPSSTIVTLFSSGNIFAVPLAALIGLPLYFNGESAIPLIKAFMDSGAGQGAMLAFLITGPGTSAGVIAGVSVILKKRAIILYLLFLLLGGIILGYLYELFLFF